jgi:hypothetical protein
MPFFMNREFRFSESMIRLRIMLLLFHRRIFSFVGLGLSGLLLMLISGQGASAQDRSWSPQRSHSLQAQPVSFQNSAFPQPVSGRRHIVAIRVAFQPDSNRYTSGDGTFNEGSLSYLESDSIHIDPLPHDADYFESHLEFARRYFQTVSNNQLDLTYQVSSQIYELPHEMAYYSPTGETFTNEPLAELARDAWQAVNAQGGLNLPNLNPDQFIFVIFHAGVGRDLELTGTTLDKTPQDIPSLYMSQRALADLLDQSNFSGFPLTTSNGSIRVPHSLILPRTLSRQGEQLGSKFVIQLSTNGLMVASIANKLGLPDLFNTENGASGIGQFGLMDGAGFFATNGLFPPELSAWEKWALGWNPVQNYDPESEPAITLNSSDVQRPHDIAKVAISRNEYYLVENRDRDPGHDGVQLTIRGNDGVDRSFTLTNLDISDENDWVEALPSGVLVEADHYDWSLPGGIDAGADGELETSADTILNGGILIWHIDDSVIRANADDNAINADAQRRGIDLEEADGAQDIGRTDADQLTGLSPNGSPYDFWWSGNDYAVVTQTDTLRLYQNRFGPDTHPATNSNLGGPTYLELYDFSDAGPTASFKLRRSAQTASYAKPVIQQSLDPQFTYARASSEYAEAFPPALSLVSDPTGQDTLLLIPTLESMQGVRYEASGSGQQMLLNVPPSQPLIGDPTVLNSEPTSGSANSTVEAWQYDGNQWNNEWSSTITPLRGFVSTLDGQQLDIDGTRQQVDLQDGSVSLAFSAPQQRTPTATSQQAVLSNGRLEIRNDGSVTEAQIQLSDTRQYVGQFYYRQDQPAFYLLTDQSLMLVKPGSDPLITNLFDDSSISWPAMVDLDEDQRLDFLFSDHRGKHLWAINHQGSVLNHFPIEAPQGVRFVGPPLLADLTGDGHQDLLIPGTDAYAYAIYAYDYTGQPLEGFPLSVGALNTTDQTPLHPVLDEERGMLWAVSPQGDLKAWTLPKLQDVRWGHFYGPNTDTNKMGITSDQTPQMTSQRLLNTKETYNWPNPAADETHIRFQVREAADIRITISSLSGRELKKIQYQANGGAPEEIRLDTRSFSNGVYYVLINAKAGSESDHHLIKMAIVR